MKEAITIAQTTGAVKVGAPFSVRGSVSTFYNNDYADPAIILEGQPSPNSDQKWGVYGLVPTAEGLLIKNTQTGVVMAKFGAGPATGTANGTSSNGKDGDLTIPYDINIGGDIVIAGGSPAVGQILRCQDNSGTGAWDSLQPSDFPNFDTSKVTTGTFAVQRLGVKVGSLDYGDSTTWLRGDGQWRILPVSEVKAETGSPFEVSTVSGVATLKRKTQITNTVFAGPATGSTQMEPTFRALTVDDLPMSSWRRVRFSIG